MINLKKLIFQRVAPLLLDPASVHCAGPRINAPYFVCLRHFPIFHCFTPIVLNILAQLYILTRFRNFSYHRDLFYGNKAMHQNIPS